MTTILVCGGRKFKDRWALFRALDRVDAEHKFTRLVHGDAPGADRMADAWAKARGVPVEPCPVTEDERKEYGVKVAPVIRNQRMLDTWHPQLGVAFPGGNGTADMTRRLRKAGVEVIEPLAPQQTLELSRG